MSIKITYIGLCLAGLVVAYAAQAHLPPLLLYNPSPSVPVGFYVRAAGQPELGDFVTVPALRAAPLYAHERNFTDRTDRFIKRVAATSGQFVCVQGDSVSAGARVVHRLSHDSAGRQLPAWLGCRTLASDEVFLLGDADDSFDGRYWGPTRLEDIDGPWRPVRP